MGREAGGKELRGRAVVRGDGAGSRPCSAPRTPHARSQSTPAHAGAQTCRYKRRAPAPVPATPPAPARRGCAHTFPRHGPTFPALRHRPGRRPRFPCSARWPWPGGTARRGAERVAGAGGPAAAATAARFAEASACVRGDRGELGGRGERERWVLGHASSEAGDAVCVPGLFEFIFSPVPTPATGRGRSRGGDAAATTKRLCSESLYSDGRFTHPLPPFPFPGRSAPRGSECQRRFRAVPVAAAAARFGAAPSAATRWQRRVADWPGRAVPPLAEPPRGRAATGRGLPRQARTWRGDRSAGGRLWPRRGETK